MISGETVLRCASKMPSYADARSEDRSHSHLVFLVIMVGFPAALIPGALDHYLRGTRRFTGAGLPAEDGRGGY